MLLNQTEKPTRQHYLILAMAWAGWVFDFYDLMLLSFLLVAIKRDLGLADTELSLLLGVSLATTALGGLFFGWLADRAGRKLVLSATILTYSLGTFLCGFGVNLPMLLVFRTITGLGVGGEWATGQTMVGETFPARMRGRIAAVMRAGPSMPSAMPLSTFTCVITQASSSSARQMPSQARRWRSTPSATSSSRSKAASRNRMKTICRRLAKTSRFQPTRRGRAAPPFPTS